MQLTYNGYNERQYEHCMHHICIHSTCWVCIQLNLLQSMVMCLTCSSMSTRYTYYMWHVMISHHCTLDYIHIQSNTNDPSAGSPTETLLRLLLPLSDKVYTTLYCNDRDPSIALIWIIYRITRSVGATGGVYKGQGRNQHELVTRN